MRATKIVATLGPATDAPGVLEALIAAGLDVARLNASHSSREDLGRRLAAVRAAAEAAGRHVAVMLDLGGPKLRVGEMAPGSVLVAGEAFELATSVCLGDATHACVDYVGLPDDLTVGDRVLLDDGRIQLRVTALRPDLVGTAVEVGGELTGRKGLNVPGVRLGVDAITPADEADLAWGLSAGVDLVAQSFVRSADDVRRLRALMGPRPLPIVAKIEKHEAAEELGAVVFAADAVMVARGDLGVETSPEDVPVIQRRIVEECHRTGTPVIIATQMLESMTTAARPTRAEASDVANAVFEGADALMLSAETAVGAHPLESFETMARIALTAEPHTDRRSWPAPELVAADDITGAVSGAVCDLAATLGASAIVTATQSGATARAVAARRPATPVLAATPDPAVARRLALLHGVVPAVVPRPATTDEMLRLAVDAARRAGLAHAGELVAVTAGVAVNQPGSTDLIQVRRA